MGYEPCSLDHRSRSPPSCGQPMCRRCAATAPASARQPAGNPTIPIEQTLQRRACLLARTSSGADMKIVILAGGSGTRLWPRSRAADVPSSFLTSPIPASRCSRRRCSVSCPWSGLADILVVTGPQFARQVLQPAPDVPRGQYPGRAVRPGQWAGHRSGRCRPSSSAGATTSWSRCTLTTTSPIPTFCAGPLTAAAQVWLAQGASVHAGHCTHPSAHRLGHVQRGARLGHGQRPARLHHCPLRREARSADSDTLYGERRVLLEHRHVCLADIDHPERDGSATCA